MDQLILNSVGFPVRNGTLSRNRGEPGMRSWSIEIQCDESPRPQGLYQRGGRSYTGRKRGHSC